MGSEIPYRASGVAAIAFEERFFMLVTERLLQIERQFGAVVQRLVPAELDGETLRLILYLKDDTNLRVTEQWQGEGLLAMTKAALLCCMPE